MKVRNQNRESEIVAQGRRASNWWTRLRGLIGVRNLAQGDGLVIEPCRGVHCMFMSIPIDVLYADKQRKVVALDRAMKPWAIGKIYRNSHYVIETPVGTIDRSRTQIGDQLIFFGD